MSDTSKVRGSASLIQKIQKVRAAALDIVQDGQIPLLLEARMQARYEHEVSPDGVPWPKLKASTIARKRRAGYRNPEKILQATGRLLASFKIIQGSNVGLLAASTGAGVRIGIADPEAAVYGRLHNYGYGQKVRRFIGLSRLDALSVSNYLRRRVKSISKGV